MSEDRELSLKDTVGPVDRNGSGIQPHPRFALTKQWDERTDELIQEIKAMGLVNEKEILEQLSEDQERRKANDIRIRSRSWSHPRVTNIDCPACDRAMMIGHFNGQEQIGSDRDDSRDGRLALEFSCPKCRIGIMLVQDANYNFDGVI